MPHQGPKSIIQSLSKLDGGALSHVIVDAVANEDLFAITKACHQMPLLTGGSALAMPLPLIYLREGLLQEEAAKFIAPATEAKTIILSGSCSAMTNAQVAHYRSLGHPSFQLDPLSLAQNGPSEVLAWIRQQDFAQAPLVYRYRQYLLSILRRIGSH